MTKSWTPVSLLLAAITFASACVSTEPQKTEPARTPGRSVEAPPATPADTNSYVLSALPTQTLELGECGLFLFTQKPSPRFVFFGNASRGEGKIRHYGDAVNLKLVEGSGDVFDQTYAVQRLVSSDGSLVVDITLDDPEPGEGGSRIPSGSLRLKDREGWVTVTPIAGATACRTS